MAYSRRSENHQTHTGFNTKKLFDAIGVHTEAYNTIFFRVTFGGHSDRLADAPPKLPHISNLTPD